MAKFGKYWFNDKWQQGIYWILGYASCKRTQHCHVDQQLPALLYITRCVRFALCCLLLRVVGSCCAKFETGQTFEPTAPNICFVPWSPKRSPAMLDPSVCTALPTLLGQRTRISHGLQWLMGCNLPMMHCSSKHCWELLHPFAQHCQHGRNNSQHCWEFLRPFARIFIMTKTWNRTCSDDLLDTGF